MRDARAATGSAPVTPAPVWSMVIGLYLLTLAAQLLSLALGRLDSAQELTSMLLPNLVFLSVLTLPACWVGVVAGRRVGLGVLRSGPSGAAQAGVAGSLPRDLLVATVAGLALGGLLVLLRGVTEPYLPQELPAYGFRGVPGGLAVSVGAAVGEEVWFRFGLMTGLVWIAGRMFSRDVLPGAVYWLVIVLASLGFALAHLPQLLAYGAAAPLAITGTIVGNVVVGVLYGWCYWRMGLLAAITAHFSVDLVLHVLTALVQVAG